MLLPTFGLPGSDNTLMAKKNHSQPRISTGRVPASNVKDIKTYFDKIVYREDPINYPSTIEGRQWTKNVVHLAGGDEFIAQQIDASLVNMGNILTQSPLGAHVTQFSKESSDDIATALSTEILTTIKEGVSLLSFFGHSSAGTFDFSLERAAAYENEGRLPVLLSMGCHSGNIHTPFKALSEEFVLEPGVGSIAFLASAGSAFITPQGTLGEKFYNLIAGDFYYSTIGEIMNEILEQYDTEPNSNYSDRTLNEQFTLNGDPAMRLQTFTGPDYTIDYSSLKTEPGIVAPENKEFILTYDVVNLGENTGDSINIRAIQYLPNGTVFDTIYRRIAGVGHTYTDTLTLQNPELDGIGENCITIELNYDNEIEELPNPGALANNVLGASEGESNFCFFVVDNSAIPVFPSEFAIVNGQ